MIGFNFTFAQDNSIPTTGNVGLGTLNPCARLNVNGRAVIDSALLVKDSINIEKDLIVNQNVRIEGGLSVNDNSTANNNFTIKGTLELPNVSGQNDFTNYRPLIVDENGNVYKSTINPWPSDGDDYDCSPTSSQILTPKW